MTERLTDDLRNFVGSCIFEFDCLTDECDGIPDRLKRTGIGLTNEVESVRCAREPITRADCGQQLLLVHIEPKGAPATWSATWERLNVLLKENAIYDDVQRAVRELTSS
ncbi:MAG: hypothetical protein OXT70_03525 [Chloroflexota bacterium]|nr:hypothetical protein [Chloroflexota bacterium]